MLYLSILLTYTGSYFQKHLIMTASKTFRNFCCFTIRDQLPLHKKWSFPLSIFLVNETKSTVFGGFGLICWRNPLEKTSFFVQCSKLKLIQYFFKISCFHQGRCCWACLLVETSILISYKILIIPKFLLKRYIFSRVYDAVK